MQKKKVEVGFSKGLTQIIKFMPEPCHKVRFILYQPIQSKIIDYTFCSDFYIDGIPRVKTAVIQCGILCKYLVKIGIEIIGSGDIMSKTQFRTS
jgi:hypothetical protein